MVQCIQELSDILPKEVNFAAQMHAFMQVNCHAILRVTIMN